MPSHLLFVLEDASRYQDTFAQRQPCLGGLECNMLPEPFVAPLREKVKLSHDLEE